MWRALQGCLVLWVEGIWELTKQCFWASSMPLALWEMLEGYKDEPEPELVSKWCACVMAITAVHLVGTE